MGNAAFLAGVNLGGWLSQYRVASDEHLSSFITERDIATIASWGLDHVRLPVDYPIVEDDATPGQYREQGLAYIDRCIEWCERHGLGVVLDLHHAPGYSFGRLETNNLFESEQQLGRFVGIWKMFAQRYRSVGEHLRMELLNEVVEPTSERWNGLAHRTIAAIRAIDRQRTIVYGGNYYSSIDELANIDLVEKDDRIIYTFHFYKPLLFTHQHARWDAFAKAYQQSSEYPGRLPNLAAFIAAHPEYEQKNQELPTDTMDADLLLRYFRPALDFMQRTGRPLYCGEFGVVEGASIPSRIRWHRDVIDLLNAHGIGRAVWTYKAMNFPLVDAQGQVVSDELIRVVGDRARVVGGLSR